MPDLAMPVRQASQAGLSLNRLVFGTAQLTQAYGVLAEASHRDDADAMLEAAADCGLRAFDTAPGYGTAELALGPLLRRHPGVAVITKSAHVPPDLSPALKRAEIERSAERSLQALGLSRLPVFLLHSPAAFDAGVAAALDGLRADGRAARVGVSVYTAEDIDRICAAWQPDVIQLPLNLFDQRLLQSGHLQRLRRIGCEIHVRSAFLQGVLLAPADVLPPWLAGLHDTLAQLDREAGPRSADRAAACLGFLASLDIDRVLVGAQNAHQLRELIAAAKAARSPADPHRFAVRDASLIDPRGWPQ